MRILFVTVLLFVSTLYLNAQPKLNFTRSTHDFGEIKEDGGMATTVFEFSNDGDQPLILNNVRATCGCTTPEWTKSPVAPGQKGNIKVTYNPKNRPGNFSKSVNVYANTQPSVTILNIKGKVVPREKTVEELYPRVMGPVRFKSNYLSLGSIFNTESKNGTLNILNTSDEPVKFGIYRSPDYLTVSFEPEVIQPGKEGLIKVNYDASKRGTYGYANDRVYLTINDEKKNNYSFSTSVTIKEDFSSLSEEELANAPVASFDQKVFDFGTINQGDKVRNDFKLTNNGKSTLLLRNVKTSCGCTAVKHENSVAPGQTIDLGVEFNSRGKRGRQNKNITVTTNDPNNPTIVLRVMGVVEVPATESK